MFPDYYCLAHESAYTDQRSLVRPLGRCLVVGLKRQLHTLVVDLSRVSAKSALHNGFGVEIASLGIITISVSIVRFPNDLPFIVASSSTKLQYLNRSDTQIDRLLHACPRSGTSKLSSESPLESSN